MRDDPTPASDVPTGFGALSRARQAGATALWTLLALQTARTVLRLGFSATTAILVGSLVMGGDMDARLAISSTALLAMSALAGLAADRVQADTEIDVSTELRRLAGERLQAMDARTLRSLSAGTLVLSLQRHPPAIAALVIGHQAASMMMVAGPLMAAGALFCVSWQAALLMLALTPAMIVFFALVGETIRARAFAQERAFGQLAGQFADRVRTLPTILANHATTTEEAKLAKRLDTYASRTMGVLRIAFLNSAIIDFFASLSIAMLALFLGLGHLKLAMIPGFYNLELWQSLFILMIAPDYFAPFRRSSQLYHAKAEGLAAAAALDRLLDTIKVSPRAIANVDRALAELELPARGLVAVVGQSGCGKSTLLRRVTDVDVDLASACKDVAWVSMDSFVPEGCLADAIAWGIPAPAAASLMLAAAKVGLLDDELLPRGLEAKIAAGGANLSGGQKLRVAVARALLDDRIILADEPTAKLDPETAELIRAALNEAAASRLVLVATHDPDLIARADRVIDLTPHREVEKDDA